VHWLDFNKGILLLEMHGTNIKKIIILLNLTTLMMLNEEYELRTELHNIKIPKYSSLLFSNLRNNVVTAV
jgi:hypothetical protein